MSNFSVKTVSSDASAPSLGENIGTVPENLMTENWYPSGGWGMRDIGIDTLETNQCQDSHPFPALQWRHMSAKTPWSTGNWIVSWKKISD